MTRAAVIRFPGSNCETETGRALEAAGIATTILWETWGDRVVPGIATVYPALLVSVTALIGGDYESFFPLRDRDGVLSGYVNLAFSRQAVLDKLIHALESPRPRPRYYVTFPTHLLGTLRRVLISIPA